MVTPRLTPAQEIAVHIADRACLLIAPAGSGKTEVLVQRVQRLLQESAGGSYRVLAVTFTVKAAGELTNRLHASSAHEEWRVDANTIHGLALDWLRRFGSPVGISSEVVVYADTADRLDILRRFTESLGTSLSGSTLQQILSQIDLARTELWPETHQSWASDVGLGLSFRDVFDAYCGCLDEFSGIDFPGMLTKMLDLTSIDAQVSDRFQRTYAHVLVDEGQDLTHAQAELLRRLVGDRVAIFVVADDRQAINAWAGGSMRWARLLVGSNARELELQHNFRCATEILDIAARIAGHFSPPRHDAERVPGTPVGEVQLLRVADESAEAALIQSWIARLLTTGMNTSTLVPGESPIIRPEDIAVIARTRYLLDATQAELSKHYEVSVQADVSNFIDSAHGRLLHAGLELRANPASRPALRRIEDELYNLTGLAESPDHPLDYGRLIESIRDEKIPSFLAAVLQLGTAADELDYFFGSLTFPSPQADTDALRFREWWANYRAGAQERDRNLSNFLTYLLRIQQTRPDDHGIRLLTAHRSKGLEFKAVALVGLSEGSFPDFRAVTDEQLDEERRAFYVATTRASRCLLLTSPAQRDTRYGARALKPSRFLSEAGLL